MKFIFAIIGCYIGAVIDSVEGFFYGACIGFIFGYTLELKNRLREVENRLKTIQSNLIDSNVMVDETVADGIEVDNIAVEEIALSEDDFDSEDVTQINPGSQHVESRNDDRPDLESQVSNTGWNESTHTDQISAVSNFIKIIKNFFTTGNVVAKVGVLVLLCGIGFLLKYAAQRNVFPVEFWLVAVVFFALALLTIGWKLRHVNPAYALSLQGGAIGILYIDVFTAAKLFSVIPLGLTFFIMFLLVVFSCVLAIKQDSRSLASLGTIGGFLAPILTSTGEGSHIALFSYYAALNAGIFIIAWFKAWRILNWLGFVFTFVIASLWGHESYRAEYFSTTEPFLILFFLFYVAISVLFSFKQAPNLKGLVDGSLVFGVPLVGFALQSQLVDEIEYGLAYSAFAMSLIYIGLSSWLWKKTADGMRLLAECFMALGVIFGSLAIPLTLDGNWTAAAWALEGAGISWVGVRQKRLLARLFGLVLQVGGGLIFIVSNTPAYDVIAVFNSLYIGCLFLSVGGFFSSFVFYKYRLSLKTSEQYVHAMLLVWALLWWFIPGFNEIDRFVSAKYEINTALLFTTLSLITLSLISRSIRWKAAEWPSVLLLPVMYFMCFIHLLDTPNRNLLSHYGYISWVLAFAVQILILYRCEYIWNRRVLAVWHSFTMYLYIIICCLVISDFVDYLVPRPHVWQDIVWGIIPALGILKVIYLRDRLGWPVMDYAQSYTGKGLLPVILYVAVWVIIACENAGDPGPLSYLPVINPLELTQLFSIVILYKWLVLLDRKEFSSTGAINPSLAYSMLGLICFVWITSVVAHSVHFYAGVRFDESAMMRSEIFQTSLSIVWTLTAFLVMWLGTRWQHRKIWYAGIYLLALVVIKLFMFDLADSGTVTRIISFISVGALMLVIGYLSPRPPIRIGESSEQ